MQVIAMGEGLMSQNDIDALLSKFTAAPPQPVATRSDPVVNKAAPSEPIVQKYGAAGLGKAVANDRPSGVAGPQPVVVSPETTVKLQELEKRLKAAEIDLKRLSALEERLQKLCESVDNISKGLQGTPGYGIRHTFACDRCGGRGTVATAYTCTSCGQPAWRGWWPKK